MKVKVGDKLYDAFDQPIMVILNAVDKENIKNMHKDATKYCGYPIGSDSDKILKWMNEDGYATKNS